jgi:hypothetical protein
MQYIHAIETICSNIFLINFYLFDCLLLLHNLPKTNLTCRKENNSKVYIPSPKEIKKNKYIDILKT